MSLRKARADFNFEHTHAHTNTHTADRMEATNLDVRAGLDALQRHAEEEEEKEAASRASGGLRHEGVGKGGEGGRAELGAGFLEVAKRRRWEKEEEDGERGGGAGGGGVKKRRKRREALEPIAQVGVLKSQSVSLLFDL